MKYWQIANTSNVPMDGYIIYWRHFNSPNFVNEIEHKKSLICDNDNVLDFSDCIGVMGSHYRGM